MSRTDIHAHYCADCEGYSPCAGAYPVKGYCLLTDRCVKCERILTSEPVRVNN
jgi:ferredoxin